MYRFILMYFTIITYGGKQKTLYMMYQFKKMAFLEFIKWSRKHT